MSVAVELGFKRYCQKCHLPFYDKFTDPVVCPHCGFSTPVTKFTQLKSSRVAMSVAEEDEVDDEVIEENIEDIEIDSHIDIGDIGVIHKEEDEEDVVAINENGEEEKE